MNDFNRSMKLSVTLGLAGAVIIPLMYECYANISQSFALVLLGAWAIYCGLKFSPMQPSQAAVGVSACLAYSGVMGFICYVLIHPGIVKYLEKHSKYFYLDLGSQMHFLLCAALIMLAMYAVCFGKKGMIFAVKYLRGNSERSAGYIDDAFNDPENEE